MVLSGEPFSGFGFVRSVSPGAAKPARRQPSSCRSRGLASHCPTGRGARSANGGFSRHLMYRVTQPATIPSSEGPFTRPAFRPTGDLLARSTTLTKPNVFVKTCLEWYRQ
jgi:hypothetical protein